MNLSPKPAPPHPRCAAVDAALAAAGLPGRVRLLPRPATTARAAADQLGCDVGAIANSLVFVVGDDGPLLVLTSGAHRVDVDALSARLGAPLRRADPAFVRRHTGQPIGGVAPVGHPQPLPTVVDAALAQHPLLWAAGGIPAAVVALSFDDLILLTRGRVLPVAG